MQNNQQPQAPQGAAGGAVNVDQLVQQMRSQVTPQLQAIFDKAVLSGMRIMFDKSSFQMTMDEMNQPGPLATRMSNGIIKLVYLLWTQSNKTLPPQILVPLAATLTMKFFQFLQMRNDPEATKQVLGDAIQQAVQGIMDRAGATEDKLPGLIKGQQGSGAPAPGQLAPAAQPGAPGAGAAPQGGGMLDAVGGA